MYRQLATINEIKIDDLSPEGIIAQKNKLPTKCLGWFDSWREKKLTKKIKKFLIENDFNLYAYRCRVENIDILWHCLVKFQNVGWKITVEGRDFDGVYENYDYLSKYYQTTFNIRFTVK